MSSCTHKLVRWQHNGRDCAYMASETMDALFPAATLLYRLGFRTIIEPIPASPNNPKSQTIGYCLTGQRGA